MHFDDPDLDDEFFAYNVIRNVSFPGHVGRIPETRSDHEDYKGVKIEKGVRIVKTPNSMIGSRKDKKNDKHFKEQYAWRRPKKKFGVPATMPKATTISVNDEGAREEAWKTYNEVKDRMFEWDGAPLAEISKKDFFVTDEMINSTPKRIMNMCLSTPLGEIRSNRKYMMDSGATFHLICWQFLTERERITVRKCMPCLLNTANGPIKVEYEVDVWIEELDLQVTAFILKDSPPLLSMGKLCRMHGFVYVWNGMSDPVLYDSKFFDCNSTNVKKQCTISDARDNKRAVIEDTDQYSQTEI
jgi:hypothetical protein